MLLCIIMFTIVLNKIISIYLYLTLPTTLTIILYHTPNSMYF